MRTNPRGPPCCASSRCAPSVTASPRMPDAQYRRRRCAHVSAATLRRHPVIAAPDDGLGSRLHADLAVESADVVANGLLAQAEFRGDPRVVPALRNQPDDLALPRGARRRIACVLRGLKDEVLHQRPAEPQSDRLNHRRNRARRAGVPGLAPALAAALVAWGQRPAAAAIALCAAVVVAPSALARRGAGCFPPFLANSQGDRCRLSGAQVVVASRNGDAN